MNYPENYVKTIKRLRDVNNFAGGGLTCFEKNSDL